MGGASRSEAWKLGGLLIFTVACSAARPAAPPPQAALGPPEPLLSLSPLTNTPRSEVFLPEHSLVISLPERGLWRLDKHGSYHHASHAEIAGELWVKRWREGERVNPQACQAQSQLWRPELRPPPHSTTQAITLRVPLEYHTTATFQRWADGETLYGQLTSHGAAIRDCFTYVFRTRAPRSPLGEQVVQQRLEAMLTALRYTRQTFGSR